VPRQTENLSEEEKEKRMKLFVKKNENDLRVRKMDENHFVNVLLNSSKIIGIRSIQSKYTRLEHFNFSTL